MLLCRPVMSCSFLVHPCSAVLCVVFVRVVVSAFLVFIFFFFKQKTAYEMRISDWSSDVCSSDLDRQILNLVGPSLQTSLGFTDFQIGMLQGLGLAIFASVAAYPMGWLADRFGRRLILAVGIICWSLATGISGLQNSFGGLFLGTVGLAIGDRKSTRLNSSH